MTSIARLSTLPVHGPSGRVAETRRALGLRQVDLARDINAAGGRAGRETVSHWENLDAAGAPRARVSRRNAQALANLVNERLGLTATDALFFEPQETAWDAVLRRHEEINVRVARLEAAFVRLERSLELVARSTS
jgi:transcriptional regulator with XRE-family HTH domain